jgi:hypothetical protein
MRQMRQMRQMLDYIRFSLIPLGLTHALLTAACLLNLSWCCKPRAAHHFPHESMDSVFMAVFLTPFY